MDSELDKMLRGELYDSNDPQLVEMRAKAESLYFQYNNKLFGRADEQKSLLKLLLGGFVNNIQIRPPFYCDYGCHIFAGDNLYINFNCTILDCSKVMIGDNVLIGPNVQLYAGYHPILASERIKGLELGAPITIGSNVWLGGGVIVCPGVSIGAHTAIGAGSVVVRSIPANVFAAGNPCKVIRELA